MADPIAGDVLVFQVNFTDQTTGNPVNPTEVVFCYQVGNGGSPTNIKFGGTLPANVVSFTNPTPGEYIIEIDSTGLDGTWTWIWGSKGTGQVITPAAQQVIDAPALAIVF